jgi:ABC-type glycerol-3-phosphate transport system substrate-binding protein
MKMRIKALIALGAALTALAAAGAAFADQPPGLRGYEGQPGNQGGPQHHP